MLVEEQSVLEYVSSGKTQWRLSEITIRPLSADVSLVTTLFRASNCAIELSPSHAVELLENAVCQVIKLKDVTTKLLTPHLVSY